MSRSGVLELARKILRYWITTRDSSFLEVTRRTIGQRDSPIWAVITCDLQPRELFCDYFREWPPPIPNLQQRILLSTHPLRRFQSHFKINVMFGMSRLLRREVIVLSTDGLSGARVFVVPYKLTIVTQWFNSPDEADEYWKTRRRLLERTRKVDLFPERPSCPDPPPSLSSKRISKNFVLAAPSDLTRHFPLIRQIVFASDITLEMRPAARSLAERVASLVGNSTNIDDLIWREAELRTSGSRENKPFTLLDLFDASDADSELVSAMDISEEEIDGIRLTLHGRERYLFLRSIAQSEFSDFLKVIGDSWRSVPEIRPYVIDTIRFPGSIHVQQLQRSRVCPDFGSSLGSMPLYGRAQTLAGRAVGLIQRFDPHGNPLLFGLPAHRIFENTESLLQSCRIMLEMDDDQFIDEEQRIRENYSHHLSIDREHLSSIVHGVLT